MASRKLTIEHAPIEEISLDKSNLRTHSEKNLKAVKSSIKRFGIQGPIEASTLKVGSEFQGRLIRQIVVLKRLTPTSWRLGAKTITKQEWEDEVTIKS